jgi:hypothetical protein
VGRHESTIKKRTFFCRKKAQGMQKKFKYDVNENCFTIKAIFLLETKICNKFSILFSGGLETRLILSLCRNQIEFEAILHMIRQTEGDSIKYLLRKLENQRV